MEDVTQNEHARLSPSEFDEEGGVGANVAREL